MIIKLPLPLILFLACAACTLQSQHPPKTAEIDMPITQVGETIAPGPTQTLELLPNRSLTPTHEPAITHTILPSSTATYDNYQRIHFDEKSWTRFKNENGLPGNEVCSIAASTDQTMWLGMCEDYVAHFDGKIWTNYALPTDWGINHILQIYISKTGDIWVGTEGNGAFRFDGKSWTHYSEEEGLTDIRIYSFLDAPDGSIWVGAETNLYRFDGNTWKAYRSSKYPCAGLFSVIDIEATPDGLTWFSTVAGLYSFDGENWTHYSLQDIPSEHWRAGVLAVAPDGTLWISKLYVGIYHFFSDGRREIFEVPGLSEIVIISSIEISQDGSVWISSNERGNNAFRKWDGKIWIIYDQLPFDEVWEMKFAPDGALWFVTSIGAFRFMP